MNIILALLVLIAYVLFRAHKAKQSPLSWIVDNKFTVIAAGAVMIASAVLPKVLSGALIVTYVLPIVNLQGIISTISHVFTAVEDFFKKLF